MRKQNHAGGLGTVQFIERRVRSAYLAMARSLKSRPEPRGLFDDVARRENPTSPWRALVFAAQACLAAGAIEGPTVLEKTRADVELFADELRGAMLAGYERGRICLDTAIVTAAREASEAQHAKTHYAVTRTPASLDAAIKEVGEMVDAGAQLLIAARQERDTLSRQRVHA